MLFEEEVRRARPRSLLHASESVADLPEGAVKRRDGILDSVERHVVAMVDHTVVQKLEHVEIMPNEVPDEFLGAARLGIAPILAAIFGNGAHDVTEKSALMAQNSLEKGG
jgi:hypothetical protein